MQLINEFFQTTILIYMVIVLAIYVIMLIFALIELNNDKKLSRESVDESLQNIDYMHPVSILVPAYNESINIVNTVQSLLSSRYPEYEIIIINDGSKDDTLDVAIEAFKMRRINKVVRKSLPTKDIRGIYMSTVNPRILLIDKENGGKADSLNCGINLSSYDYFCSIDGDCILGENSIAQVMAPMVEDPTVIAAGGNVKIANGSDIQMGKLMKYALSNRPLVMMQVIEYFRAFLMGRITFSRFNMVFIISGAFSIFSKKEVIEVGGYLRDTIGEDMELVVRLHRLIRRKDKHKKIKFLSHPICWTEAPETISQLKRQRSRWHQGLIESLWRNKTIFLNPRYGGVAYVTFPYFLFIECLGPIIEFGGYLYLVYAFFTGRIFLEFAVLLLLLFVINGALFSMVSVIMEAWIMKRYLSPKDILRLFILAMTEIFWYKPMTLWFRLVGIWNYVRGKSSWGDMERKGL